MKMFIGTEEEFVFIYNMLTRTTIHGADAKRLAAVLLKIEHVLEKPRSTLDDDIGPNDDEASAE